MTEIDDLKSVFLCETPLIDTRSPSEFAKGSLPTAVNLPLMTDQEREGGWHPLQNAWTGGCHTTGPRAGDGIYEGTAGRGVESLFS
jgi:hypothetical protein